MPTDSPTEHARTELLMRAALVISTFRNKNREAGYPFREPPDAGKILLDIDSLVNASDDAQEIEREKKRQQRAKSRACKRAGSGSGLPKSSAIPTMETEAGRAMVAEAIDTIPGAL